MAITRTQIAKQLLANGGRTGFFTGMREQEQRAKRGPRDDPDKFGPSNKAPTGKGEDKPVRRRIQEDRQKDFVENPEKYKNFGKDEEGNFLDIFNPFSKERKKSSYNLSMLIPGQTARSKKMQKAYKDYLDSMGVTSPDTLTGEEEDLANFFVEDAFNKPVAEDAMLETPQSYGEFIAEKFGAPGVMMSGNVGGLDKFVTKYEINPDGTKGKPLEFGYRQRDDYGEGRNATSDYERRLRELEQSIAANPITSPVDDEIINYRLMADGGRIGFFTGMREQEQRAKRGPRDDPDKFGPSNKAPTGKGEDGPLKPSSIINKPPSGKGEDGTPIQADPRFDFGRNIGKGLPPKELARFFNEFYGLPNPDDETENTVTVGSEINTPFGVTTDNLIDTVFSEKPASDVQKVFGTGLDERIDMYNRVFEADGGRIGLMEGGMPYEGGIMDLESARQMYGLGKLVKKITRGVKKIAKSPIGKAALAFGAYKLASPFLLGTKGVGMDGGLPGFLFKQGLTKGGFGTIGGLTTKGILAGIGATSALSGLMTKEEDEEPLYAGADIDDPRFIMANYEKYLNPRLAANGGLMRTGYQEGSKEPVAKKVMPLLDMDGQEKDYRETGGFVDMGRMEKADDVPARLSKNEFVFTADAVRNAGEGNVDKGAEVMYNMMKNLESGGEVSEESQGLEGAREMFQTSQRLEEVL